MRIILLALIGFVLSPSLAMAEEKKDPAKVEAVEEKAEAKAEEKEAEPAKDVKAEAKTKKKAEEKKAETKSAASPLVLDLNAKVRNLAEGLGDKERRHFFLLYNNHNIIATVKTVRSEVGNAVKACGEENPDLKEKMGERYETWKAAVSGKLDEAQGYVDNMVVAQDYTKASNIRSILKKADELRVETAKKVQKVPVTAKKDCLYLLNKMDETQDTMVNLLDSTLIAMPQLFQEMPAEDPSESKL